ncbi:hypothetical protein OG226_33445 [Streptomyces sp. NBC_01261]|uniref:hypothetical protein n=1 Tax=unclassified Streptomyces TaxID=2593676 RepID=UPI002E28BCCE|nr:MULTISPECIES: hypothetical protein [unclassified Streptomyces]
MQSVQSAESAESAQRQARESRAADAAREAARNGVTRGAGRRIADPSFVQAPAPDSAPRPKVRQTALRPPDPGPLPERERERYGDEYADPMKLLLAKVSSGQHIAAAGERSGRGDRDPVEEEWRAHDRRGPYGQERRRRN